MKGATPMPTSTYITLIRFTQKGMEAIKEGPARLDAAKQAFQALGAKIKDFYLVTGKYDAVVVAEAPDDETIVKLSLGIAAKGNSRHGDAPRFHRGSVPEDRRCSAQGEHKVGLSAQRGAAVAPPPRSMVGRSQPWHAVARPPFVIHSCA